MAPSVLATPDFERVKKAVSELPDLFLSDLEFDFLDSAFFRARDKLPSPDEVRQAIGSRTQGVCHFQHLGLLVKYGLRDTVRLEEAVALRLINKVFPDIPAPEVYGWKATGNTSNDSNFIYMSLVPGETLHKVWHSLTHPEKESVSHQLAGIIERLRSVEQDPADQFIGSLSRGPVQDVYFRPDYRKGPFSSAQEFHDFVQFVAIPMVPVAERSPEPFRAMLPDTSRICLTHGDLNLYNVLVVRSPDGHVHVSGIVDWEQAGWYPEYWEYCKAMIVGPFGDEWREDGWVNIALQPYEHEYEAFEEYWSWRCP